MKKIVQVILISFAIGMLASIGMATAEIYFVSLGGIFGGSSIAVNDVVLDSVVVQPQGTAVLEADCEPDGIFLDQNGVFINFDPPYSQSQVGVRVTFHIEDDLAGNSKPVSRFTGMTVTIDETNAFVEPTTVVLVILCYRAQFFEK